MVATPVRHRRNPLSHSFLPQTSTLFAGDLGGQHGTDEFTQHAAESGADRLFDSSDITPKNVAARTDDDRRATTPPILPLGATHQLANTYCRIPTDAHATFAVSSAPQSCTWPVARVHVTLSPVQRHPLDDERPAVGAGGGLLARHRRFKHSHLDVCDFHQFR